MDINELLQGVEIHQEIDEKLTIDNISVNGRDLEILEPIEIKADIYNTDDGIFLSGKLIYIYSENCARCLKEFKNKVETKISAKIVGKNEDIDEYEVIIYHSEGKFNLEDIVITFVNLSLPMRVLCKDDCKGLCPKCGKNLNEGECNCEVDNVDPRLEKLKELFD
ncbi:YceD family protein [Caldisalinibacter kiritimatiensis]|uniref:YceD family protein n=1 Tax=Caldisalinibacter kiritimatiensis TaxID=1304284 RepID=UPI001FA76268|nr:DUF177 domain-containing protein [Caldisalinibacter kiritimatiensis]